MIDAGILSERIGIYVPKSEHYNLTTLSDYELLKTVWANVRQITTREQLRYGIDVQSGQMTVLIRYLAGISDDCLILWRGSYYSIDNISPDKAAGEILMGVSYSGLNENGKVVT